MAALFRAWTPVACAGLDGGCFGAARLYVAAFLDDGGAPAERHGGVGRRGRRAGDGRDRRLGRCARCRAPCARRWPRACDRRWCGSRCRCSCSPCSNVRRGHRQRAALTALAAYVVGGLLWGIPLIVLSGGPAAYLERAGEPGQRRLHRRRDASDGAVAAAARAGAVLRAARAVGGLAARRGRRRRRRCAVC